MRGNTNRDRCSNLDPDQRASEFDVLYGTQLPLDASSLQGRGPDSMRSADNTGVVQLEGLLPETRYYYAVRIGEHLADLRLDYHDRWPSFRTLPDASVSLDPQNNPRGLFNYSFSIGCCASQDPVRSGGQYTSPPAFDTLLQQFGDEIAFHIMNGDTTYEELRDGTREGIRANYRLYWQRGRSWSRLLRNVPTLFTYDDHEIGWDIHGCGEVGLGAGKWLIRDFGTSVWKEYCGWASYPSDASRPACCWARPSLWPAARELHDPQADFSKLDLTTVSTLHIDPYTPKMEGERLIHRPVKQSHKNAGVYRIARVIDAQTLGIGSSVEGRWT